MKRLLIAIPLLFFISPVNAFWGLSEEEKNICRERASRERNEFSAKQTYNFCSKNIKSELKEKERRKQEYKKNYDRWYKEVGKYGCIKEEKELKQTIEFVRKNPSKFVPVETDDPFHIQIDPDRLKISSAELELSWCKEELELKMQTPSLSPPPKTERKDNNTT